jgi:tRNA-Thr(GGU) m(6)t(6)A37 methyltransferase TsaA
VSDGRETQFQVVSIGFVRSPLRDPSAAPKQGDEGAPEASIMFEPDVLAGLDGIRAGEHVLVLTWLDRADREVLRVHPRGDRTREPQGVFATRSPHRPNPIGLHRVEIVSIHGPNVDVLGLEAIDGTPVLDVKPLLSGDVDAR